MPLFLISPRPRRPCPRHGRTPEIPNEPSPIFGHSWKPSNAGWRYLTLVAACGLVGQTLSSVNPAVEAFFSHVLTVADRMEIIAR